MSDFELNSPIPQIPAEDLPDIMAYSMLKAFVADLEPKETTPGMLLWAELRKAATGEANYSRWSRTVSIDGENHTVALFSVYGELPNGEKYAHNALRCSCGLPDHKSFTDLQAEYKPCPAKDMVIAERAEQYRKIVGAKLMGKISVNSLSPALLHLTKMAKLDTRSWPPSDRSDRLLLEPMAQVFDVSVSRVMESAEELAEDNVIELHGSKYPSMSLAI